MGLTTRERGRTERSEVALALGGRRYFPLGELEAFVFQRAFGGVRDAPAQHPPDGLLELVDAHARFVGGALRLGLRAACRVQLVDEVLGRKDVRAKRRVRPRCGARPRRR